MKKRLRRYRGFYNKECYHLHLFNLGAVYISDPTSAHSALKKIRLLWVVITLCSAMFSFRVFTSIFSIYLYSLMTPHEEFFLLSMLNISPNTGAQRFNYVGKNKQKCLSKHSVPRVYFKISILTDSSNDFSCPPGSLRGPFLGLYSVFAT